jgi:hypothetical protein
MHRERAWRVGEKLVKTLYLADRIVLRDRRLPCRKGLVFVAGDDGSPWYVVIYDAEPQTFEAYEHGAPIPFAATTPDGLWLEGVVQPGNGDAETRTHVLHGLGRLEVRGETVRSLPSAATWAAATRARRVS